METFAQEEVGRSIVSRLGEDQASRLEALLRKHPQALTHILSDELEEEPVLSYIIDLEARREIFLEFEKLAKAYREPGLNAMALAIIMVAPITQLRELVRETTAFLDSVSPPNAKKLFVRGLLISLHERAAQAIKACMSFWLQISTSLFSVRSCSLTVLLRRL